MANALKYDSREWFLETVTFDRLWRQWTKRPDDREILSAVVESLERLGLSQPRTPGESDRLEQDVASRSHPQSSREFSAL